MRSLDAMRLLAAHMWLLLVQRIHIITVYLELILGWYHERSTYEMTIDQRVD